MEQIINIYIAKYPEVFHTGLSLILLGLGSMGLLENVPKLYTKVMQELNNTQND